MSPCRPFWQAGECTVTLGSGSTAGGGGVDGPPATSVHVMVLDPLPSPTLVAIMQACDASAAGIDAGTSCCCMCVCVCVGKQHGFPHVACLQTHAVLPRAPLHEPHPTDARGVKRREGDSAPLTLRQLLAHPFFGAKDDPDQLARLHQDFDSHFSADVTTSVTGTRPPAQH